jgi:Tfp pilus assembly protein FimT
MTLLELLITVTVLGMVLAASIPSLRSTVEGYRFNADVNEMTSKMFLTRQLAVREKVPYVVTLAPTNDRFTIFEDRDADGVQDAGEKTLGPYLMDVGVSLLNVNWGGNRMTFRPNGTTSQTGDVQIVDGRGRSKTIRINTMTGNTEVLP